jgi:pyruvate dehydrogenase E2 component (dihydrolipoamide acetyltransferase)
MNILMPQLGETVAEGKIVKWFKAAGDAVKPGDNLFEIETDKTSMEVPATSAGTLSQILFQVGETAKVGAVVAVLSDSANATVQPERSIPDRKVPPPAPLIPAQAGIRSQTNLGPRLREDERSLNPPAATRAIPLDPFNEVRSPERNFGPARLAGGVTVTPLARRLAGENGIDLARVKGSGPHGRIVALDVEQAIAEHRRPGQMLGPSSAEQLVLTADVEVGALLNVRDEANAARPDSPIAIRDFVVKAWALALQRVPAANAAFAQDRILQFDQSDIAVAIEDGTTALILGAQAKTVGAIAQEVRKAAMQAIEVQGGSTAVVCPDVPGIRDVTIPVRPPQASLLAVGAVRRQPFEAADNSVRFGSVVTATLCCDRRVIDAAVAAQLLSAFKAFVEKPVTMLV